MGQRNRLGAEENLRISLFAILVDRNKIISRLLNESADHLDYLKPKCISHPSN